MLVKVTYAHLKEVISVYRTVAFLTVLSALMLFTYLCDLPHNVVIINTAVSMFVMWIFSMVIAIIISDISTTTIKPIIVYKNDDGSSSSVLAKAFEVAKSKLSVEDSKRFDFLDYYSNQGVLESRLLQIEHDELEAKIYSFVLYAEVNNGVVTSIK